MYCAETLAPPDENVYASSTPFESTCRMFFGVTLPEPAGIQMILSLMLMAKYVTSTWCSPRRFVDAPSPASIDVDRSGLSSGLPNPPPPA